MTTRELIQQRQQEAEEYCQACLLYKDGACSAFKELFHLWNDKDRECWARETNPVFYQRRLMDIRRYLKLKESSLGLNQIMEELRLINPLAEKYRQKEIELAYLEDVHRKNVKKGGGGEKADRTNKTFGPQQMKDNRFVHRKRNPRKYMDW